MGMIPVPDTDVTNVGNAPGAGPLRAGGQPGGSDVLADNDLPSTASKSVKRQAVALKIVRDLDAGPERVRACATEYLPQSPGEDSANYADRLARSVFLNAFGQTKRGMVGMIFRRDPVLSEDVPEVMAEHWENIDLAGTHGDVFCRQLEDDATCAGHAAILVDFPKTNGTQTAAQDTGPRAPIRPYWVPIKKEQIVSWRTTVEDGRQVLTQLVLKEVAMVPSGKFGEREQTRYRVLYREHGAVGFRVLAVSDNRQVTVVEEGTYPTQDEIPVAEIQTCGSTGLFESAPPLIDLAYLNVAHYQQASDLGTVLHKQTPVLVTIGLDQPRGPDGQPLETTLVVGPNSGLNLPTGGDAKYIAADGSSLGEMRAALADLKADMASAGLQMLAPEKRAAETLGAKRIDKSTSDSALSVSARALQDGIERALGFHAKYLRQETGGSVVINRDFEALVMDAQTIAALSGLVKDDQLTLETLWSMLIEGNVTPDDFDPMKEKANLQAEADIKAQQAAEAFKQQQELAQAQRQGPAAMVGGPKPQQQQEPVQQAA